MYKRQVIRAQDPNLLFQGCTFPLHNIQKYTAWQKGREKKRYVSGIIEVARKLVNKQYHNNTEPYGLPAFLEYEEPIRDGKTNIWRSGAAFSGPSLN